MTTDTPEQVYLQAALAGDADAFGDLVRLYERPVYNLAYRMLGNGQESEDAAQEAFIRAYTHLDRYDPTRSFKTWLLSITSNYCIDLLRKRRLTWLSLEDEQLPVHPALVSKPNASPEAQLLDLELSQKIQTMLNELPADYRVVVILRYWYDLSYFEIAEMLQTTESAIKSRLFRARQSLAKNMDESLLPLDMPDMVMNETQGTHMEGQA